MNSQAFPCELNDEDCLFCEIDDGRLSIGVECHELDFAPFVSLGRGQIENLVSFLQSVLQNEQV